jgi:hypothetical protein
MTLFTNEGKPFDENTPSSEANIYVGTYNIFNYIIKCHTCTYIGGASSVHVCTTTCFVLRINDEVPNFLGLHFFAF